MHRISFPLLIAIVVGSVFVFSFAGCGTTGGGLVAHATGDLHGAFRANSEWVVLIGEGDLDYGLALTGVGPITIPTTVEKGGWGAYDIRGRKMHRGKVAKDPLPAGTAGLFPPGDAEAIATRFGLPPITFAAEPAPPAPPVEPDPTDPAPTS